MMVRGTLGGLPILGSSPVRWTLREGTLPSIETFDMAPLDAIEISTRSGPVELEIIPAEGNPVRVTNLWVLNVSPGSNPYISKVTVADRRWMWSYAHVLRRYNMRRNVGTKRILASDQAAVPFDRAPQVAYWNWSMNKGVPWQAFAVLEDVLSEIGQHEKDAFGTTFKVVVDDRIGKNIKTLPIEELQVDDPGDQAINRVVAYLPEGGTTVDYDGTVVVFSRAAGDERKIVEALLPELVGEGHVDLVENRKIRPCYIDIFFTRELEMRVNYVENALASGSTTTADPPDTRTVENVLAITDYQLPMTNPADSGAVNPFSGGVTLPQDSWITMDQAFLAYGYIPVRSRDGKQRILDHDLVQRAFIPEMDLWEKLELAGQQSDSNWIARIAAVQTHYRRTFRLSSRLTDRVLSIRAYRLATIDPQSGQRGPAQAYGDYSIMYTQRSKIRNLREGKRFDWAINKTAYPTSGNIDSTAVPSPAIVSIPDSDQGIIHVDYVVDPNRVYEMILPSQIAIETMPTADVTQRTRSITFDSVTAARRAPKLSASFKLAILFTVVPAAPNTKAQLHRIRVYPRDIKDLLPEAAQRGLESCDGPPMEVRVGPQVEVARIQWKDDRSADIERAIGMREGEPNLKGLVLNEETNQPLVFGASLNAIARARAASIYGALVDRFEGEMAGHMNGQVHLSGWVSELAQEVDGRGQATTRITMPERVHQMSLFSFLSSAERAAIMHLVQPL